jgi:hypothetical protein
MKLAEALAVRADASRRIEQLRVRIAGNARYQEGELPTEDATTLLTRAYEACDELESLIRRINRTNAATALGAGTITDAIASNRSGPGITLRPHPGRCLRRIASNPARSGQMIFARPMASGP